MKKLLLLFLLSFALWSCSGQKPASTTAQSEMKPEKNDEGEWELNVLDSQYNYFLNAVAKPRNMYTESYLKTKNTFLVSEWNNYYMSGRYRDVIESNIIYDSNEKYGFEFEYRLYQVFAYVSWKYGLRMQNLSGSDVIR